MFMFSARYDRCSLLLLSRGTSWQDFFFSSSVVIIFWWTQSARPGQVSTTTESVHLQRRGGPARPSATTMTTTWQIVIIFSSTHGGLDGHRVWLLLTAADSGGHLIMRDSDSWKSPTPSSGWTDRRTVAGSGEMFGSDGRCNAKQKTNKLCYKKLLYVDVKVE